LGGDNNEEEEEEEETVEVESDPEDVKVNIITVQTIKKCLE